MILTKLLQSLREEKFSVKQAASSASMTLLARTGRHRQRYGDDRYRLVAGCIPYRLKQNSEEHTMCLEDRLEVLMISSPNRDDLVFPKGGWEDDETIDQAACREALEEAGVKGKIHEEQLGVWEFRSKSRQNSCSTEGACRGYMFALRVTEELDSWPEETCHKRRWLSVPEARKLCRYPWMHEALDECVKFLDQADLSASDPSCYVKPSDLERLDGKINISHCRASCVKNVLKPATLPASDSSCYVKPSKPGCLDSAVNALCCGSS